MLGSRLPPGVSSSHPAARHLVVRSYDWSTEADRRPVAESEGGTVGSAVRIAARPVFAGGPRAAQHGS
jgi:hypothetical protein